ncbi:MAG: hypothetical protein WBX26_07305 [Candidatus Cybelea sp.]
MTINISGRAVAGAALIGIAVAISSLGIVRAERESVRPDTKVFNCTSGKACVEGNATGKNSEGVFGNSAAGTGVQGNSTATNKNSGVAGVNSATTGTGYGVYGRSSNGPGMYGTSAVAQGMYGTSTTANGVEGHTSADYGNFAGVAGFYDGAASGASPYEKNAGVYGFSDAYGSGVVAEGKGVNGTDDAVLKALGDTTYADLFYAQDNENGASCTIDPSANLQCTGTISGGKDFSVRHRTSEGGHVLAYAAQSASETIEDVGTARMSGGVANVQIDPAFASIMDRKWYYVFLSPLGDTRGLYVSVKTASAFQVRETEHGRSNLEFDYRILAHPLGSKNDRLPAAPAVPKHRLAQPAQ